MMITPEMTELHGSGIAENKRGTTVVMPPILAALTAKALCVLFVTSHPLSGQHDKTCDGQ
ncbi:hypothetical protein Amal_02889 [Acetobacter malorum]|uniref:Uncharacterized protein n=1 Tax=Acetobacter malorum TaxID=178901 RepID=A0A177G645_9PROT|nr:hypothetical protein Amal_02889 [Acetobacter malorum]